MTYPDHVTEPEREPLTYERAMKLWWAGEISTANRDRIIAHLEECDRCAAAEREWVYRQVRGTGEHR